MELREALESAIKQHDTAETVEAPAEVTETVEPTEPAAEVAAAPAGPEGRARDESGRFKAAEKTEAAAPAASPAIPAAPAPVVSERRAPSSWKPDAQKAFLKADRGETLTADEIKLLIGESERRESDFHKGVSEFKTHSERARAYDNAVAPYLDHIQKAGVDAPTAIGYLLKADHTLRTADPATKARYLSDLARQYGVDIGQAAQLPATDPEIFRLRQENEQLRRHNETWQNQIKTREDASAASEIEQFASSIDPALWTEQVRNDVADLLESGKATTLKDAHEMAVWMRPDVRQSLIEKQREEASRKAVELAQAQRAKTAAAIGVKGSSPSAGNATPQTGDLRSLIASQVYART